MRACFLENWIIARVGKWGVQSYHIYNISLWSCLSFLRFAFLALSSLLFGYTYPTLLIRLHFPNMPRPTCLVFGTLGNKCGIIMVCHLTICFQLNMTRDIRKIRNVLVMCQNLFHVLP